MALCAERKKFRAMREETKDLGVVKIDWAAEVCDRCDSRRAVLSLMDFAAVSEFSSSCTCILLPADSGRRRCSLPLFVCIWQVSCDGDAREKDLARHWALNVVLGHHCLLDFSCHDS
eukprot:761311-Hanusia_phi.AAC.3